eukprot:scaffold101345_cov63-Phaeocystis_antarctica.AAC.2
MLSAPPVRPPPASSSVAAAAQISCSRTRWRVTSSQSTPRLPRCGRASRHATLVLTLAPTLALALAS